LFSISVCALLRYSLLATPFSRSSANLALVACEGWAS
jgi:hypothetical protein